MPDLPEPSDRITIQIPRSLREAIHRAELAQNASMTTIVVKILSDRLLKGGD